MLNAPKNISTDALIDLIAELSTSPTSALHLVYRSSHSIARMQAHKPKPGLDGSHPSDVTTVLQNENVFRCALLQIQPTVPGNSRILFSHRNTWLKQPHVFDVWAIDDTDQTVRSDRLLDGMALCIPTDQPEPTASIAAAKQKTPGPLHTTFSDTLNAMTPELRAAIGVYALGAPAQVVTDALAKHVVATR